MDKPSTAHDFSFPALDGGTIALSDYAGRPILLVNTASACGFTKQYKDLQSLWESYRLKGLVVLGVPSDDFGGQEPGDNSQIQHFCDSRFGVSFPMTTKQGVKGEAAHGFYRWARHDKGWLAAPKWNFHKYLIDGNGQVVDWFYSPTAPQAPRLVRAIVRVLPD